MSINISIGIIVGIIAISRPMCQLAKIYGQIGCLVRYLPEAMNEMNNNAADTQHRDDHDYFYHHRYVEEDTTHLFQLLPTTTTLP